MRFILTILFSFIIFCSEAQIIRANAYYTPLSQPLLLDVYTGAAAAYSLRKLRTAYTGAAIRVRRSSDNTEQDIGFVGVDLDTVSLKNFVGANSGFVTTWYSQGDSSAVNFTQTTAASQPRIVNAGTIDRENTKPAIVFDGSNDFMSIASSTNRFNYLHNGTQSFILIVTKLGITSNPNALYLLLDNKNTQGSASGYSFYYDDRSSASRNNAYVFNIGSNVAANPISITQDNALSPNSLLLINHSIDADNSTISNRHTGYVNNAVITTNNAAGGVASSGNSPSNMFLGRISGSSAFHLNGSISELIFYNSVQSANRTAIQNNINSFYVIY